MTVTICTRSSLGLMVFAHAGRKEGGVELNKLCFISILDQSALGMEFDGFVTRFAATEPVSDLFSHQSETLLVGHHSITMHDEFSGALLPAFVVGGLRHFGECYTTVQKDRHPVPVRVCTYVYIHADESPGNAARLFL